MDWKDVQEALTSEPVTEVGWDRHDVLVRAGNTVWRHDVPGHGEVRAHGGATRRDGEAVGEASPGAVYGGGAMASLGDGRVLLSNCGALRITPSAVSMTQSGGMPLYYGFRVTARFVWMSVESDSSICAAALALDAPCLNDAGRLWRITTSGFAYDVAPHPSEKMAAVHVWQDPAMPWHGSRVEVRSVSPGAESTVQWSGVDGAQCTCDPQYSPCGRWLGFRSDHEGVVEVYAVRCDEESGAVLSGAPMVRLSVTEGDRNADSRWDVGGPPWAAGVTQGWAWVGSNAIVYVRCGGGLNELLVSVASSDDECKWSASKLEHGDLQSGGSYQRIRSPYSQHAQQKWTADESRSNYRFSCVFSDVVTPSAVLVVDLDPSNPHKAVQVHNVFSCGTPLDRARVGSVARESVACSDTENEVHCLVYNPPSRSPVPEGGRGVVFFVHGGPTAIHMDRFFALRLFGQVLMSRGWMVVAINYFGSWGAGREYREALTGQWGIADVASAVAVARSFADRDDVNKEKLIICGGSAGGYLSLRCLQLHPRCFAGAMIMCPVSNLESMDTQATHLLERHYNAMLVPRSEYKARSVRGADIANARLVLVHGTADTVVPVADTRRLHSEILAVNSEAHVKLQLFEGAGHMIGGLAMLEKCTSLMLELCAEVDAAANASRSSRDE